MDNQLQLGTLGSILREASYMLSSSRTKLLSSRYWATWKIKDKTKASLRNFISLKWIFTLFHQHEIGMAAINHSLSM